MERSDYKLELGDRFEKQIFEYCYKFSMNNGLSLDWLHPQGIKQYYIAQCERIKFNLQKFPELRQVENIMKLSDLNMNKDLEMYNLHATFVDRVYSQMHECGRCKKKKIIISKMQVRSADEGMTIIYTCDACGWRRTEN